MNRIRPVNLEHTIIDCRLCQDSGNFRGKSPFRAAAGEHHLFAVSPGSEVTLTGICELPRLILVTIVYHDESEFLGVCQRFDCCPGRPMVLSMFN